MYVGVQTKQDGTARFHLLETVMFVANQPSVDASVRETDMLLAPQAAPGASVRMRAVSPEVSRERGPSAASCLKTDHEVNSAAPPCMLPLST